MVAGAAGRRRSDRGGAHGRHVRHRQCGQRLGLERVLHASSGWSAIPAASAPSAQAPWGGQRSDETLLSGDTAAKVREAALAKVPGATVVRVETDADGNATYQAHMVKADGTPVTVYVNKQFEVVSVQTGMPGPGSAHGNSNDSSGANA